MTLNRTAMQLPKERLVEALKEAIEQKKEILQEREKEYGANRVGIVSYGENLYMPGTFGFEMKDFYTDPHLAVEMSLRSKLFWLQNSKDDCLPSLDIGPCNSMYYDMTLFGQELTYTPDGVPNFQPHPLQEKADLSLIRPFDFYRTGEMPMVLSQYEQMKKIVKEEYDDCLTCNFPGFSRGPLDLLVQLRGYENFVMDTIENPSFIQEALLYFVEERARFRKESAAYLGEGVPMERIWIADDWVNIPFISPDFFEEYVVPAYLRIQELEGPVVDFHTCGRMEPLCKTLSGIFPSIRNWDISGWNNLTVVDEALPRKNGFNVNFINSFVLTASAEEQKKKLLEVKKVSEHRILCVTAQSIVKLLPTLDETFEKMNDFIDLARNTLAGKEA